MAADHGPATTISSKLAELAQRYPKALIQSQVDGIPRIAYHIELVKQLVGKPRPVVADIGGGLGLFSPGCAVEGMEIMLVDDFRDPVNQSDSGIDALSLHRELGVTVNSSDVLGDFSLPADSFDAITCFDSMEHWHSSPRKLFHSLMESLRSGGWFILSVPNCVDLKKRITVPLGYGKWSPLSAWYEEPVFRAHVREPDVEDLRYIAKDLGLKDVKIMGRNWQANKMPLMAAVDALLRLRPSLCANIYMVGRKA